MRKTLNENPVVQMSVLGVGLLLVVGLLFMRMSGGGGEAVPTDTAATSPTGAPATPGATTPGATVAPAAPGATTAGAPATTGAPQVTPAGSVDASAWQQPGPGLPAEVVNAWKRDDAVVLLVVRETGIDDRLVQSSARRLTADPNVALFVTPAEKVARYSRITQAVGLNRVPALIVIRPKDVAGAPPQAIVSYGFRDSQSVVQAVRDALYKGKDDVPYYPG
jgi:hypothetical protein